MTLRTEYQSSISVDTLYEVRATGKGSEQLKQIIEIIGGTANIYVSQIDVAGAAPTGMSIITNGAALQGTASFDHLPNYLYVENIAGVTNVVLSGINVVVA